MRFIQLALGLLVMPGVVAGPAQAQSAADCSAVPAQPKLTVDDRAGHRLQQQRDSTDP